MQTHVRTHLEMLGESPAVQFYCWKFEILWSTWGVFQRILSLICWCG